MSDLTVVEKKNYLEPSSFSEAMEFSKMLAASDLAPKDYKGKPGNIMVAMQLGYEVGLKPMQAVQNIAVINGRPCVWGDALLAIVQGSGKLKYIKEWEEGDVSYCETKRVGYPEPYRNSFSDTDARAAGLLGKTGPWQTNKRRMRQMRARAFNLRDQFADIIKGLNVAEEVEDYVVADQVASPQVNGLLPKRKSEVLGKDACDTTHVHEKRGVPTIHIGFESAPTESDSFEPSFVQEGVLPVEMTYSQKGDIVTVNTGPITLKPQNGTEDPFLASVQAIRQEIRDNGLLISEAQRKRLFAMAHEHKVTPEQIKDYLGKEYGYTSSKEILKNHYEAICNWIEGQQND